MKKINILFTIWATRHGGAEHFVLNIIKNLDRNRYNVVIFSDSPEKGPMHRFFKENGAKIIYTKVNRFKHPIKHTKQLKEVIVKNKINIIHGNDDLNIIYSVVAKTKNVGLITHSHTTNLKFTGHKVVSVIARKIFSALITRKSDVRLCCSSEAGRAMFGRKAFQVIPNGIELNKFCYKEDIRRKYRKEFGFSDNDIVIGHVGRLVEVKNHIFMLQILKELNDKRYKAVFVGGGDLRKSLTEKARELRVEDRVLFLGDRDDTCDIYNMFDLFLFPSFYEGLPNALLEAQANGLPIIASSAIPIDVKINRNLVFKSIVDSAEDWKKEICKMNIARAVLSKKMQKYSLETTIKKLVDLYEDAYKNSRSETC